MPAANFSLADMLTPGRSPSYMNPTVPAPKRTSLISTGSVPRGPRPPQRPQAQAQVQVQGRQQPQLQQQQQGEGGLNPITQLLLFILQLLTQVQGPSTLQQDSGLRTGTRGNKIG